MTQPGTPIFRVEMLPAQHGDCILLSYGPVEHPKHILIDGGTSASYPALAARLQKLPKPARLELVVVTHIDSDHIGGIVQLLADTALKLEIDALWFNGWEQLSRPMHPLAYEDPRVVQSSSNDRSAREGHYLVIRGQRKGLHCNADFGGTALCLERGKEPPELVLPGGMTLTLLSPDIPALEKLRKDWHKKITAAGLDPNDPSAMARKLATDRRYRSADASIRAADLMASLALANLEPDAAIANGSSIAFIAEYAGKRCALLADAHMPVVEASLAAIAARRGEKPLRIDAVKVSHHGSSGNTTATFLKLVDCAQYLISTDGSQFAHPDKEAIARILDAGSKPLKLVFNYASEPSLRWADAELQEELQYAALYPPGASGICVDLLG